MKLNLSLRARLTLLSTLVTAGAAVILTLVSLYSADLIFVQSVPTELLTFQTSPSVKAGKPDSVELGQKEMAEPPSQGGSAPPPAEPYTIAPIDETIQISLTRAGRRFNLWGISGLILVTLLGAGVTWLMAGRALRPVRELSSAIQEVSGTDLSIHVETGGRQDEIGQLAHSFNDMMDKVRQSFERQKRFSASAAHELKTPLATMQVGLEVLELDEHPSPARMEKALAIAKANTGRMIRLMEDLFRLSSDQECDMQDEIPIPPLFAQIASELEPLLQEKHLSLSIQAEPGLQLSGSQTMLYHALFNLAENAAKYNREGGSIALSAAGEGSTVVIRVSDTGIGIAQGDLEHIFEPFYRVDRSRSRSMGGSGLGLALVKDIVERHGGSIQAASTPGEGTVFTLQFPAAAGGV